MDHVEVQYGRLLRRGRSWSTGPSASGSPAASLSLTNSLIDRSSTYGLRVAHANPTVSNDNFHDNARRPSAPTSTPTWRSAASAGPTTASTAWPWTAAPWPPAATWAAIPWSGADRTATSFTGVDRQRVRAHGRRLEGRCRHSGQVHLCQLAHAKGARCKPTAALPSRSCSPGPCCGGGPEYDGMRDGIPRPGRTWAARSIVSHGRASSDR